MLPFCARGSQKAALFKQCRFGMAISGMAEVAAAALQADMEGFKQRMQASKAACEEAKAAIQAGNRHASRGSPVGRLHCLCVALRCPV